ncbi:MAG: response regulator [bacterium]|nr:response regulator [bacterium]
MARILVIDDSATVVQKLRQVLGSAGHSVSGVERMIELPSALKPDLPDLVLLDLHMPALSGSGFAKVIRKIAGEPIPTIIYSAASNDELSETAVQIEADGIVRKTDSDERLLTEVTRVLTLRGRKV